MRSEFDVAVIGSGAGGLTAALAASLSGLDVIVVEHQPEIGGTAARSSGTVWVPDNHYLRSTGVAGDGEQAQHYLASLVGNRGEQLMWQSFLANAPRMIEELDKKANIGFRPYLSAPDYRQDQPGAASGGRPLEPLPFDGRQLGADFDRLAWPLPELMLFKGMMITRSEAAELLRADRSASAAWLGLRLVARYLRDRIGHRRGTRLVLGNALIGHLLGALKKHHVPVLTNAHTKRLIGDGSRIQGLELEYDGGDQRIHASRGVILAGGGFPASAHWRERYLPQPVAKYSPASPGADGSTLALAQDAGAALGPAGLDDALWFPSSVATRRDGSTAVYPHIVLDRSKPGLIAVDASAKRFTNEAVSYHEFVRAMYGSEDDACAIPAWLICDSRFIRRYGLGIVRPRTFSLRKYIDNAYLRTGSTIAALADNLGLSRDTLKATVSRFNGFARSGVDEDFHKGENMYDRSNGDPVVGPNPCLAPIERAPFYAVAVWPTPLGTSRGLRADVQARVLNEAGKVIPGLYVCGNDMQSAFGGEYPGAGAQIGQAMTFGWLAGRHAAGAGGDDS